MLRLPQDPLQSTHSFRSPTSFYPHHFSSIAESYHTFENIRPCFPTLATSATNQWRLHWLLRCAKVKSRWIQTCKWKYIHEETARLIAARNENYTKSTTNAYWFLGFPNDALDKFYATTHDVKVLPGHNYSCPTHSRSPEHFKHRKIP
jgi:hypothetical protein